MPVGLPDPSVHNICIKCRRWFKPDDGAMVVPEATGPIGKLRSSVAAITGDESAYRFICYSCAWRMRRNKIILWSCFAIVVAIALLVAWLRGEL